MSFDEKPESDIHGECREEIKRLESDNLKMVKEYTRMQTHFQEAVDRINDMKKRIYGLVDYSEQSTGREHFIRGELIKICENPVVLPRTGTVERREGKRKLTGDSPEVQGARKEPADFI